MYYGAWEVGARLDEHVDNAHAGSCRSDWESSERACADAWERRADKGNRTKRKKGVLSGKGDPGWGWAGAKRRRGQERGGVQEGETRFGDAVFGQER